MINQKAYAICKERGHSSDLVTAEYWNRCKWCGVWLREVRTIEEREDDPPEDGQSPIETLKRLDVKKKGK